MKTVLAISDSVEGTPYDLKRTTKTIKGYKMDPLLVVPAIFERSGNHVVNPSDEILDYVFGDDCDLSAITIGYMTEQDVVEKVASRLHQLGKGKVPIIYQPSLFTDDGEILVNEDLYYSICDNLLPCVDLIIINRFEAELLSEMECHTDGDFTNAAREISKQFRCSVLIRHVEGKGRKNLLFNGVSSLWIITPPHLIDGANKNYNLMSAVACSMAEKPLIGSAIRNAIYFCSIDKTKPQELYEEEELEEYIEPTSEVAVVPEETIIPEIVVEEVQEIVEEPVQVEPELSDEESIQIIEEVQVVEEITEEIVTEEVVVEETPAVEEVIEKAVEEPKVEEPVVNKVSAADAIAAAKAQSGLLFGGNMPEHRQKVRAPLTSTPVPKFGSNSILGNSKSIIAAPSASETSSTTTTSSLVSPVKTLRDIARTLDNISRDGEEIPAVTSTIEKPAPGPKAPVSDLTPESTAVRLQSLRERLNNMTGSDKH